MKRKLRHFLDLNDYSGAEILALLKMAARLKSELKKGKAKPTLVGKTLGMVFEKPSVRTRVSFEVGMFQLGGTALNLAANEVQMGVRESVEDMSRVLSRYLDFVMLRTHRHSDIETFAAHSSVPVINGLSDLHHPCQAMADLLTIQEEFGRLKGLKLAYVGDGNNVCNSLIAGASKVGMSVVVACPRGFDPDPKAGKAEIVRHPVDAIRGADVVYTDVWTSMGQEKEKARRLAAFKGFTITPTMMKKAKSTAIFLHCLPAHRGEEVSEAVLEGKQSRVFDQAENRLHAQKAIISFLGGI